MPKFEITANVSGGTGKVKHVIKQPDLNEAREKFIRAYPGRRIDFINSQRVSK